MTDSSSKSQQQLLKEEIEKELEEYFSYLDKNFNAIDLTEPGRSITLLGSKFIAISILKQNCIRLFSHSGHIGLN
ncbi:Uncharacterized protein APZ42_032101 [Daphnia magna]|uniref:Uncharacterized protein n=1 Tax=Daphnia magna TaxID=35525 RepID=A0A164M9Y4_9CRUS|nr:Uncharacterized protein APZ42_032101 [Daphnia magna]